MSQNKCWHIEMERRAGWWICSGCGVHLGDDAKGAQETVIGDLAGLCGCGRPELSRAFLSRFLWLLSSDNDARDRRGEVEALVRENPEGAAEVIMQWAAELELTEHGGSVPGWTDGKGEKLLELIGKPAKP